MLKYTLLNYGIWICPMSVCVCGCGYGWAVWCGGVSGVGTGIGVVAQVPSCISRKGASIGDKVYIFWYLIIDDLSSFSSTGQK